MLCLTPFKQAMVRFDGELDLSAQPAMQRALQQIDSDVAVVDLTEVTFMDSSALVELVALKRRLRERGRLGIIKVIAPSPRIARLFSITGLVKVFDLHPSAASAGISS